jgi:peroxiredoxin
LPVLEKFALSLKNEEAAVYTISSDMDTKDAVKILAKAKCSLPVLQDASSKTSDAYRVFAIPTFFVIDQQGKIYNTWYGGENLEKRLKEDVVFLLDSGKNSAVKTAAVDVPK